MKLRGIVSVLFLSLLLISCGSSGGTYSSGSSNSSGLVGTWKMMTSKDATAATATDTSSYNVTLVMASNGTWTVNQPANAFSAGNAACTQGGTYTSTSTALTIITTADTCHTPAQTGTETDTYSIYGTTATIVSPTNTTTWLKQ